MKFVELKEFERKNACAASTCNCGSCNCNCGSGSACHNKCMSGETVNLKKEMENIYKK